MKLTDKNNKIILEKDCLETLIKNIKQDIINYSDLIKINLENHSEFVNFVDLMDIYEIYKWDEIKSDYIKVKKNITITKKNLIKINQTYGNIANYYNSEEQNILNHTIKKINEDLDLIIYNFNNLKKVHYDTHNKCKYMNKNLTITKIENKNDHNNKLIDKIYQMYDEIKLANKQLLTIRSKKMEFLSEINKLKI